MNNIGDIITGSISLALLILVMVLHSRFARIRQDKRMGHSTGAVKCFNPRCMVCRDANE